MSSKENEDSEDIKWLIRSRESQKYRQHNGQKENNEKTNSGSQHKTQANI